MDCLPDTRIIVLLVWLILSVRVSNLRLEVVLLALDEIPNAGEVCVLHVSV